MVMDFREMVAGMLSHANATTSPAHDSSTGLPIPNPFGGGASVSRPPRNPLLDSLGPLIGGQYSPILRTLTAIHQIFDTHFGLDPTLLLTIIGALWAFNRIWRQLNSAVVSFVSSNFMSSITISSGDEIYTHMMKWLAVQPMAASSRSLTAETVTQTGWEEEESELEALQLRSIAGGGDAKYVNFSHQQAKAPPRFVPAVGQHGFWHGGRYFRLQRRQQSVVDEYGGSGSYSGGGRVEKEEMLVISCFGRSTLPIKQLLRTVKEHYFSEHIARTTIKRPTPSMNLRRFNSRNWITVAIRPVRSLNTVVLDAGQKAAVLADMNEYLHPATPRWYANRGIPLRRGYLFHGPPGTGKTSLSFALAGVFGLDIFVISLLEPTLSEEDLSTLFSSLPRRCVVLLEDIDAAGLKRTEDQEMQLQHQLEQHQQQKEAEEEEQRQQEQQREETQREEEQRKEQERQEEERRIQEEREQEEEEEEERRRKERRRRRRERRLAAERGEKPPPHAKDESTISNATANGTSTPRRDSHDQHDELPETPSSHRRSRRRRAPSVASTVATKEITSTSAPAPASAPAPTTTAPTKDDTWRDSDLARVLKRTLATANTQPGGSGNNANDEKKGISLSGLLNAIDGVASQEGRVLVMTTNRPESLDEALIRPGRVDLQVAFSNASSAQARELFERMYEADTSPIFSSEPASEEKAKESAISKVEKFFEPVESPLKRAEKVVAAALDEKAITSSTPSSDDAAESQNEKEEQKSAEDKKNESNEKKSEGVVNTDESLDKTEDSREHETHNKAEEQSEEKNSDESDAKNDDHEEDTQQDKERPETNGASKENVSNEEPEKQAKNDDHRGQNGDEAPQENQEPEKELKSQEHHQKREEENKLSDRAHGSSSSNTPKLDRPSPQEEQGSQSQEKQQQQEGVIGLDEFDNTELKVGELQNIAVEFGKKIPDGLLSPAEIQGFLLKRKKEPRRALDETDRWVAAMKKQKESKSKVLSVQ